MPILPPHAVLKASRAASCPGLPPTLIHVDAKTGDVIEAHSREVAPGGLTIPMTTKLSDYRNVQGMRLPFRIESSNPHTGTTLVTIEQVHTKQRDEPGRFTPMPEG